MRETGLKGSGHPHLWQLCCWFTGACGERQPTGRRPGWRRWLPPRRQHFYFALAWTAAVAGLLMACLHNVRETGCLVFFLLNRVGIEIRNNENTQIFLKTFPLITLESHCLEVLLHCLNFLPPPTSPIRILWKLPVRLMWWLERWFLALLVFLRGWLEGGGELKEQGQPHAQDETPPFYCCVWILWPAAPDLCNHSLCFFPFWKLSWLVPNWTFGPCFDSYILIFSNTQNE